MLVLGHILYMLVFVSIAIAVPTHRLAENAGLALTIGTRFTFVTVQVNV